MLTVCQQQALALLYVEDKSRNGIDGDGIGHVSRQPYNNGDISMVSFPRQGERAVDVNSNAGNLAQFTQLNQIIDKSLTGFHRSNRMRA